MEKLIILVNIHYLLFFLRDTHEGNLSLENADLKQSNFAIELKNFEKGTKYLKKKLLFSAREKSLKDFKSRLFPIKNLDKIPTHQPTPEPAAEPTTGVAAEPTKYKKSKLKLEQENMNEI